MRSAGCFLPMLLPTWSQTGALCWSIYSLFSTQGTDFIALIFSLIDYQCMLQKKGNQSGLSEGENTWIRIVLEKDRRLVLDDV
ncbi:hypothetical protein SETIT_9G198300v2 [Setaria italica]|uniref:Uncharacterized protein n=1 Tax=Setaria italica TaxID=4555 RepID=A0A368SIL0_SETIT|nr:hypothetical protein SETIT_9G198300v2 [Setaria italica]